MDEATWKKQISEIKEDLMKRLDNVVIGDQLLIAIEKKSSGNDEKDKSMNAGVMAVGMGDKPGITKMFACLMHTMEIDILDVAIALKDARRQAHGLNIVGSGGVDGLLEFLRNLK